MVIKDELIEPYFIRVQDSSFDLVKSGVSEKGNPTESTIGYYTKLSTSLIKVSKLKTMDAHDEINLRDYAKELEEKINLYTEKLDR